MPDRKLKKELIKFIRTHKPSLKTKNLNGYSITQLIILKTGIESKLKDRSKKAGSR